MYFTVSILIIMLSATGVDTQEMRYTRSTESPFGQLNPQAPAELKAFAPMIGQSQCQSAKRLDQDNWAPIEASQWVFRYIMNGTAVQDENLVADGSIGGSIRLFDEAKQTWQIHYYNNQSKPNVLPVWNGGQQQDRLVFYRPQIAPNGMEGHYRLTFYEITDESFLWKGEWVNQDESVVYPTWKISCKKISG